MWRIRNELDFLIVKNTMLGVRDAIVGQILALVVFSYLFSYYVPQLYLFIWLILHLLAYGFRLGLSSLFQQIEVKEENFHTATSLLRLYLLTLCFSSILWGGAVLFFDYIPQEFHFFYYMVLFGSTFASVTTLGAVQSMLLAFILPTDIILIVYTYLNKHEPTYSIAVLLLVMALIYSLRTSKIYHSIYYSLIKTKLDTQKALQEIKQEKENLQQYIKAIEEIGLGIIVTDESGRIIRINTQAKSWFGDIEGLSYNEFLSRYVTQEETYGQLKLITTKKNKVFEINIKKLNSNQETFILLKDVTEEIKSQRIVEKMAERYKERAEIDALTHVLNRESFMQRLERMFYETDRTFKKVALLFIDLDNFKSINDTYGHRTGDLVLQVVAKRIQNTLRQSDLLGRYAGDEFIVALKNIENEEIAHHIATKLLYALSQPITIDDYDNGRKEIYVTVSIGISIYPDDAKDLNELVNKADRAMYRIKSKKKNGYEFYDSRSS